MNGKESALAARIRREIADVARLIDRAESLTERARRLGESDILDGAALNLHAYYAAAEHIFEDIAREIDGSLPSGGDWHRTLLLQMASAITDVRPSVIGETSYRCLDEYRGFRHVVRNVYTFNLRPDRIEALVGDLRGCYESLASDVESFATFLDATEN